MSSCNQHLEPQPEIRGPEPRSEGLTGIEPRDHCAVHGEKAGNNLRGRQHGNRDLKHAWGTQWGDYLLLSEHIPERKHVQGHHSGIKETGGTISLPHPSA